MRAAQPILSPRFVSLHPDLGTSTRTRTPKPKVTQDAPSTPARSC